MIYISVDGGECSGKSTTVQALAELFKTQGREVFLTKEPGSNNPASKAIRKLLLDGKVQLDRRAALCLFLADRAQHISQVRQALDAGKVVISDRSSLSSMVYYLADEEGDRRLTDVATEIGPLLDFAQQISPDFGFICNAGFDWSWNKLAEREVQDRIESKGQDFHKRVHKLFSLNMLMPLMTAVQFAPRQIIELPGADKNSTEQICQFIMEKVK